jgi:excisionase family DNA binding protein
MIHAHEEPQHPKRRATDFSQTSLNPQLPEPLLTLTQACRLLCLSSSTLYRLAERRQVPFIKIGCLIRFERSALDAWLAGQRKTPVTDWQLRPSPSKIDPLQKTTGGLK